jgi:lipoprotein-anchoring transpeptidase ErfK/SrfK
MLCPREVRVGVVFMRRICVAAACAVVLVGSYANAETNSPEPVINNTETSSPEPVTKNTETSFPKPVTKNTDTSVPQLVIKIDKSSQRVSILVDGSARHVWAVSTGLEGGPPTGTYRPYRLHRKWYSRKYHWSPMPHSIFFHEGYAIHGTQYVSRLGRQASHGCVRLHPANAAALFALVREHGRANTQIVVEGSAPVMAKAKPRPVRKRIVRQPYFSPFFFQPFF